MKHNIQDSNKIIKFIINRFIGKFDLLTKSINLLLQEKKDYSKTHKSYYPVPAMLLCCSLLDSLRRINYIWHNGKDGNENKDNGRQYKSFLDKYLIKNKQYQEFSYNFSSQILYEIRCDLVHSFGLKKYYKERNILLLISDLNISQKNKIKEIVKAKEKKKSWIINILGPRDLIKLSKCAMEQMLIVYQDQLMRTVELNNNLLELYEDTKETEEIYEVIEKGSSRYQKIFGNI